MDGNVVGVALHPDGSFGLRQDSGDVPERRNGRLAHGGMAGAKQKGRLDPDPDSLARLDDLHRPVGGGSLLDQLHGPEKNRPDLRRGLSWLAPAVGNDDVKVLLDRLVVEGGHDGVGKNLVFPGVDRRDGVHHHEEGEQEGDEVGVGDQPPLEVFMLLVLGFLGHDALPSRRSWLLPLRQIRLYLSKCLILQSYHCSTDFGCTGEATIGGCTYS